MSGHPQHPTTSNRVPSASPESSNHALSGLSPSDRPTFHQRQQGGVASNFGAPLFQVEELSSESTLSVNFAPQGNEARSNLSRRDVGTPNARAGHFEEDGMEVDSVSEASDESMPTQPPAFSDVEMPSRSPSQSDAEMEDLSMAFETLNRSPSSSINQDVEMEDLSMSFNLLFGDGPSIRQQQQQPEAPSMAQMDGGSAPVSALVSCTGVAEATAEETAPIQNASFWSSNNAASGPGSPMDFEVVEAESTEANLMPVNNSDRISTRDASSIHQSTDDSANEVEQRVSAQRNAEETPRQEPLKPSETTEPATTINPDSFHRSNPSSEMPEAVIPTTTASTSNSNAIPVASKSPEPGNNNSEEDGEPLENGQAEESPQLHFSTSANEIMNTTEPSEPELAARPTEAESAPMQKQPAKKKPPVKKHYHFSTDPEPKHLHLAQKRNPLHNNEEPPRKIRKLMCPSGSEVAQEENNVNEAVVPQVADELEDIASVAESIHSVQDADISPAMSIVSGIDAESDAPIEANALDALNEIDESDAESKDTAYWVNVAEGDRDQAGEDEPGQPWMHHDLPDEDDTTIYDEPGNKLIDTDDNISTADEEEHEIAAVPVQAEPSIANAMPSDDEPSGDGSSDDEDANGHVPERDVSPSPAPSVRLSPPVTPADGSQTGEVEKPGQFDDVEIAPIEVNDNGNIIEAEPVNIEAEIPPMDDNIDAEPVPVDVESTINSDAEPEHPEFPPMDDNSEAEDAEMEDSDDTVPSDAETDQLVSEGSSDVSEDESMDVDEPEDLPLAAPQAAKPSSRNPVDPWKTVNSVESFANATLPAPNNVIVKSMYVQEFNPLTPDQLKQEVSGDAYIAALYNGIVVFQGSFDGVPLSSALLSEAAVRPQVLYNDPTDPIKWMGGGRNHLVLLGESGRLYLIGRAAEGQLGQDPSRHRYRAPTPLNMRRRVLEEMEKGPNGKPRVRSTPEIKFGDVEAAGNVTIAWSNNLAFMCGTSEDGAECWSSFKRYPRRDRNQGMDAETLP